MKLRTSIGAIALAAASLSIASPAAADSSTHYTGTLADGATWIADVPSNWNGTLLLFSHGFGPTIAADAPAGAASALLASGYALAGSSYDPNGSWWALDSAVRDQFQTLSAVESGVLPSAPRQVLAVGQSMGGLVSALEAQNGAGRIDGALTTCGIVAGAINLNNYQLDGEYALARLLLGGQQVQLTGFANPTAALATAARLQAAAATAQRTLAGRARLALALAFLNAEDGLPSPVPPDPVTLEADQYHVEFTGSFSALDFIEFARPFIDAADGGNASWNAGVDYGALLRDSPYRGEVAFLYREAGISLRDDLANLTANANITADPAAVASLEQTSVPTGWLAVPELDLHTISDPLVPVQQENFYAHQVRAAGSGDLLRQAYVASVGHCNFSTAEIEAGVMALAHRVTTGRWDSVTEPDNLNQVARSLGQGPARFIRYRPGPLTGATQTRG
jgi:pimeloyl-ACP methyl ester carboxylesterase